MRARVSKVAVIGLCLGSLIGSVHPPESPVADAAMQGDIETLQALLYDGADVNAAQGDGMTALHWAADRGDPAIAQLLLLAGATVDAVTKIGHYTPLHLASRRGTAEVVELLLTEGSDPHARTITTGVTPLHLAAAGGNPRTVGLLLDVGADPNARESEWGQTPLIFSAAANRFEAVPVLLKGGADPEIESVVMDFVRQSRLEGRALQREGQVLDALVGEGGSPTAAQIQTAVRAGRKAYLEARDSTEEDEDGPMAQRGFRSPLGRLVEKIGGLTPLLHAARQGNLEALAALIDGGADVDHVSGSDGTSPLLIAALNGQFDVLVALLDRGADPNVASELNGVTPLWGVLNSTWQPRTTYPQPQQRERQSASHLDAMGALLDAGADPDARLTKRPWYMVHNGCGSLDCGMVDVTGSTAFFRAAYATDVPAMKLLIDRGATAAMATFAPPKEQRFRLDDFITDQVRDQAREALRSRDFEDLTDSVKLARLQLVREELSEQGLIDFPDEILEAAPDSMRETLFAEVVRADSIREDSPDASGLPRVPAGGEGIWPIHAASGAGYGEGFAGNSHRHAPDGWLPAVQYLVEELEADVNARDFNGYTPLHHAAARGDNDLILYLVEKGADVTAVSRYGETTVDMANGPVQRLSPFPETIALLEGLGAKNNHNCYGC